ncbi:hypothetical protein [Pustulibacterium marinum]|nr:hypothetical protein [Pustulibacterium marinum]
MMTTKYTKSWKAYSFFTLVSMLLISCGTYQNSSYYDNDGIYNTAYSGPGSEVRVAETAPSKDISADAYRDYFNQVAVDYEYVEQDSTNVFTDIESYASVNDDSTNVAAKTAVNYDYVDNYGGWGQNTTDVTVNIYDNGPYWGWNNYYYGWNNPYYNYGWGWNRYWGWNSPYYGWSVGFGNPYWYGGFYGGFNPYYGYYSPYYYGNGYYYGSPYYRNGRQNVAYATGRRGSTRTSLASSARRNTHTLNNSSRGGSSIRSRINNSNRSLTRTIDRSQVSVDRNGRGNNTVRSTPRSINTTRSNTTISPNYRRRTYTPSTRSNNNVRTRSNNTYTPRTNTTRTYTPSRSTTRSYSPSRSSGGVRSSGGGSVRSSGGGGRRGGR